MLTDFQRFPSNLQFLLLRKVEGRQIGLLYASLQGLGGVCLLVFENAANKVFYINSEYVKRINKFLGPIC